MLTDAGHVTPHMVERLNCCDALALECNHDLDCCNESIPVVVTGWPRRTAGPLAIGT